MTVLGCLKLLTVHTFYDHGLFTGAARRTFYHIRFTRCGILHRNPTSAGVGNLLIEKSDFLKLLQNHVPQSSRSEYTYIHCAEYCVRQ